jgi:NhaC family Na+:H+ antiporter
MTAFAAFAFFTCALVVSVAGGISIIAPLLAGLAAFAGAALRQGHSLAAVVKMMGRGVKKSMPVMAILLMIGVLTAVWRSGGTIPLCVYYGLKAIHPRFFVLSAFVLACCFSYAIGSCFGTTATIGVILMVVARNGGVDENIAAGAILSGAFFGDRCAPTSSSANLVAVLTGTKLYGNIRNMFKTAFIPMILALVIYLYMSLANPMCGENTAIISEIAGAFDLDPIMALPAVLILLLPLLGVDVKKTMAASILAGMCLTLRAGTTPAQLAHVMLAGYQGEEGVRRILEGGGIASMARVVSIVLIASTYSGIFDETGMLRGIQNLMERLSRRVSLYLTTMVTGVVTTMFACNQTLAVILTVQIVKDLYERSGVSRDVMAIDLEDTVILIAGLVPWCIAVAVPMTLMSVGTESIPYAVFLWITPLVNSFPAVRGRVAVCGNSDKIKYM